VSPVVTGVSSIYNCYIGILPCVCCVSKVVDVFWLMKMKISNPNFQRSYLAMFVTCLVLLFNVPRTHGFSLPTTRLGIAAPSCCTVDHSHSSPLEIQYYRMSALKMVGEDSDLSIGNQFDPIVKEAAIMLRRLSWLTWWSQLSLTTVSAITLLFARNVIEAQSRTIIANPSLPNFLLAGISIGLSFFSIFWTWANRRLARRLLRKPTQPLQAATMLRRSINAGVTLNLFGMLASLISAEQIVGALAIKVLTAAPGRTTVALLESSTNFLQPLDILVVQANTNTLFSHFTSLVALLYMTRSLIKLDPPNREK